MLARPGGCVSSPRFVDRRNELLALEAALARTREGVGSVVFVGGEAGIGKSRLISELARRAERDGMTVVVGECLPLGGGKVPYAPVVGALRSLVAQREGIGLEAMLQAVEIHRSGELRDTPIDEHLTALATMARRRNMTELGEALRQRYPDLKGN